MSEKGPFRFFQLEDLRDTRSNESYLKFLSTPRLETGLYRLKAGSVDRQTPHERDEVYHIISGKAQFEAGSESISVKPGDVLYVAAHLPHKFINIREDLEILVFFSAMK